MHSGGPVTVMTNGPVLRRMWESAICFHQSAPPSKPVFVQIALLTKTALIAVAVYMKIRRVAHSRGRKDIELPLHFSMNAAMCSSAVAQCRLQKEDSPLPGARRCTVEFSSLFCRRELQPHRLARLNVQSKLPLMQAQPSQFRRQFRVGDGREAEAGVVGAIPSRRGM